MGDQPGKWGAAVACLLMLAGTGSVGYSEAGKSVRVPAPAPVSNHGSSVCADPPLATFEDPARVTVPGGAGAACEMPVSEWRDGARLVEGLRF